MKFETNFRTIALPHEWQQPLMNGRSSGWLLIPAAFPKNSGDERKNIVGGLRQRDCRGVSPRSLLMRAEAYSDKQPILWRK